MRGAGFHCHIEYCTSRWRAGAGVIGETNTNGRFEQKLIPCDHVYEWKLKYEPNLQQRQGHLTFSLGDDKVTCEITQEHFAEGATFTHFGLLPVMKSWDDAGEAWLDDVTIESQHFDFTNDPKWDALGNHAKYETTNTRPRFNFGWSPTHYAGGVSAGEMGGLIFRGDCREAARLGAYGDRISTLNLDRPFFARGVVSMVRGVSDSTASIGFYNSVSSLRVNPAQDQSIPMDYVGINIEGPSSEGFFFYPVYRAHGATAKALNPGSGHAARIYPDGMTHHWSLNYEPAGGANGQGQITVKLDQQSCTLDLETSARTLGGSFDRFGICTPWNAGNSVTAYFDDLEYTSEQ
jgi:hypothetical protein